MTAVVLMGGWSAERPISLKSGEAVLAALQQAGVTAEALDVDGPAAVRALADGGWERAFIALHGRGGEDGVIQGCLEAFGIPYTGSGVLGSALAMDKLRSKRSWRGAGLPTPDWVELTPETDPEAVVARLGLPLMVKPAREGSSIGMSRVERAADLESARAAAAAYDDEVFAERWVTGEEYTVALLNEQILPAIRLETPRGFYDYAAKYSEETTRYHCPAGLSEADEAAMGRLSRAAFAALDGRGWGRVDILRDGDGTDWLVEVNTVPGMTDHSLVPMAAAAAGLDFPALARTILDSAALKGGGEGAA